MRLVSIKEIEPLESLCIEVDAEDRLYAVGGDDGKSIVTHNSVVQRNIIFSVIARPQSWRFLGIDLKRVELSPYRKYSNVILGIATELEDAVMVLRFASQTMMKRYTEMEQLGYNNFLDLPEKGQALMVMVDEAGELLSEDGGSKANEAAKQASELKGEASMLIGSIARLGRAAGVHLIIATQRPDAKLIAGETKANLGVRINCGTTNSTASSMILENGEGTRVRGNPRGRLYLQIYGKGDHGQGFFAGQDWIDKYLEKKGLNPDGTPLGGRKSKFVPIADINELAESTLDEKSGIDNTAALERLRREEEQAGISSSGNDSYFDDEADFAFEDEPVQEDKIGRPEFTAKVDENRFHRPEDDWDQDLEDLIKLNDS